MALFGGSRPKVDWSKAGTFLTRGTDGLDRRRDEEKALQVLRDRTMQEDRLRAALSPADGPMGSGTGAAPNIQQQMAALDEARLLNPEVADAFAPYVQGQQNRQQAQQLFADDPRAQALWASGNPEFRKAQAEQYAPQVVAAGASQVVNGRRTVEQPTFGETGDTTIQRTSQGVVPVFTRTTPSISEQTAQIVAGRPQLATPGQNDRLYGVDASGNPTMLAGAAPAGANGRAFDATTRGTLQSASNAAAMARARASDAQRFLQLNQKNPTGLGAAILGPLAGVNPAYAEMRSISAKLIPKEREPGSGSMSDGDARLYGRAVLDIDKPGPTNQAMANVVIAQAQRDTDYASFLDEYALRNGNLAGSNEDWQAYVNANPLFEERGGNTAIRQGVQPWRKFMGWGERQRGGAGGQPQAAPQAGGDRAARAREILRQRGRL